MPVTDGEQIQHVCIVGVGLIGASFALALRQAGFQGQITGVSSPAAVAAGTSVGAIDRGVSLEEAAASADLIYLAQPVDRILSTLEALGHLVHRNCMITDAGSTKLAISRRAEECLRPSTFLGGHPMAGKEQRGAEAASADLFCGRPYVLCSSGTGLPLEPEFRRWLAKIGACVLNMSPQDHDRTVALTSHLPQLLSTALSRTLAKSSNPHTETVFGPGLVDMTRLALSSPDLWLGILSTNQRPVQAALDQLIEQLGVIRELLGTEDLRREFQEAANYSAKLRKLSCT